MEGMPQPVDINKLKNILGNAKKIMQVTENGNYKSGNIDGSRLVENTDSYLTANQVPSEYVTQSSVSGLDPTRGINYNEQTVMNSRLPENIKKAMLENPIPQVTMGHTFNYIKHGVQVVKQALNSYPIFWTQSSLTSYDCHTPIFLACISRTVNLKQLRSDLIEHTGIDFPIDLTRRIKSQRDM